MDRGFRFSEHRFVPPFVPPLCLCYPLFHAFLGLRPATGPAIEKTLRCCRHATALTSATRPDINNNPCGLKNSEPARLRPVRPESAREYLFCFRHRPACRYSPCYSGLFQCEPLRCEPAFCWKHRWKHQPWKPAFACQHPVRFCQWRFCCQPAWQLRRWQPACSGDFLVTIVDFQRLLFGYFWLLPVLTFCVLLWTSILEDATKYSVNSYISAIK